MIFMIYLMYMVMFMMFYLLQKTKIYLIYAATAAIAAVLSLVVPELALGILYSIAALKNRDKYGHISLLSYFSHVCRQMYSHIPSKGNDSDILLTLLEDFSSEAEPASTFHFI